MNRDIICHIGFPKTGTTYLQNQVFPLLKNINYVTSEQIKSALHDIIEKDDSYYDENNIRNQIDERHIQNQDMLFSYEPLSGHHIKTECPNRSQIARRLKRAGVSKIIITIRNQTDILESTYKQYIKSGGVLKISEFFDFEGNQNPWFYIKYFDFESIIDLYIQIFGRENVLIIQYEDFYSKNNILNHQFAEFLKIEKKDFHITNDLKINKSLSNFSIKLLRIINHFTYNSYRPSSLLGRKFSTHLFFKILKYFMSQHDTSLMISKYQVEIISRFSESNEVLQKKFNIKLHEKYGV